MRSRCASRSCMCGCGAKLGEIGVVAVGVGAFVTHHKLDCSDGVGPASLAGAFGALTLGGVFFARLLHAVLLSRCAPCSLALCVEFHTLFSGRVEAREARVSAPPSTVGARRQATPNAASSSVWQGCIRGAISWPATCSERLRGALFFSQLCAAFVRSFRPRAAGQKPRPSAAWTLRLSGPRCVLNCPVEVFFFRARCLWPTGLYGVCDDGSHGCFNDPTGCWHRGFFPFFRPCALAGRFPRGSRAAV